MVLGRAIAAHAKVEHGNQRNSFKSQKGSWLKARNLDTVKKAKIDHPNKTTKSVDVTSISSKSKPITVGPNCRKPKAPPARLAENNQRSRGTRGNPRLQGIQFASPPIQQRVPRPHFMTQAEEKAQQEVESLMMEGTIKETRLQGGFISNIHIVPKKEGGGDQS